MYSTLYMYRGRRRRMVGGREEEEEGGREGGGDLFGCNYIV
jgi:hypothetical protein